MFKASLLTLIGLSTMPFLFYQSRLCHYLKVWNWSTGNIITIFSSDAVLTSVTFEPAQRIFLAGDINGRVHVLRVVGLDHLLFPDDTQKPL
jgi:hypothetical protein